MDAKKYERVIQYWTDLRNLPSFQEARRIVALDESVVQGFTTKIQTWKRQYSWVRQMYQSEH